MRTVLLSLLFAILIVVLLIGGFYVYARGHGFSARGEPGWMERTMARNARNLATPRICYLRSSITLLAFRLLRVSFIRLLDCC